MNFLPPPVCRGASPRGASRRGCCLPRPFIAFLSTCASPSSLKLAAGCTVPWSCGAQRGRGLPRDSGVAAGVGGNGCRDGATRRGDAQAGGEVSASTWGWGRTSPPPGRPLHPRARRSQAGRGWGGGCRRSPKSRSAARCRARAEAPRGELGAAAERQERVRKGFQLCVCALLRYPAMGWVSRAHAGPAATARERLQKEELVEPAAVVQRPGSLRGLRHADLTPKEPKSQKCGERRRRARGRERGGRAPRRRGAAGSQKLAAASRGRGGAGVVWGC